MKRKLAAVAVLASCAVFAGENGADFTGEETLKEDVSPLYLLAATTTTTVRTSQLSDGSIQIIEEKVTTIRPDDEEYYASPEDGDYTYVEYEDAYVPYYRGYFYIDSVWVWRGYGIAAFPPPKFRPRPHPHRPHHPHHKPAPPKPAPVKPAAVKPAPAKPAAPRGGHAPAGRPR